MARVKSVSELNKLKVRLFFEAVLNEGRLELIDELVAADYVGHVPCAAAAVTGPEGVRRLVSSHRRAHPSLYIKIEDQIAEDDLRRDAMAGHDHGSGGAACHRPRRAHPVLRGNLDHPAAGRKASRFAHRIHQAPLRRAALGQPNARSLC